jgi:putative heme-binding domain-containing protein
VPKVEFNTERDYFAAFASPNLATRALARAAMQSIPGIDAVNCFMGFALLGTQMPQAKAIIGVYMGRGLWMSESLPVVPNVNGSEMFEPKKRITFIRDGLKSTGVQSSGLDMSHVQFAVTTLRAIYDKHADFSKLPVGTSGLLRELVELLPNEGRRELLLALRNSAAGLMRELLFPLAKHYDGHDHFYLAALNIACGTDPARRDAILADFDKHFPDWNDKVADLVWELRPKSMLPKMEKLLGDEKLTPKQKARIIDILAGSDDVAAGKTMISLVMGDYPPEVKSRAIDNLKLFLPTKWAALKKSDELTKSVDELMRSSKTWLAGMQLIAAAQLVDRADRLEGIAIKPEDAEIRTAAIRTLGQLHSPKAVEILVRLTDRGGLLVEVAQALGQQTNGRGSRQAMDALLKLLKSDNLDVALAAVSGLADSRAGSDALLKMKEKNQLPERLVADTGRLLRNSPFAPERNKAMLLFPPPGKLDPRKLPAITVLAKRTGNAENGRKILAASLKNEAQCLKCHTVRGVGGQVGPDLSMIGKKASRENLIESILSPSKAIADQFLQWRIETKKGLDIQGLIVEETADSILLRDANAKDYRIAKSDIDTRTKSAVSIMPADIVAALTEDELIDLVEYLATLKTASLTPDWWHIVGPFPNDGSDSGLDKVYEPENKVDLSVAFPSPQRKQRELKWTKVVRDGAGYVDLQAHYAPKSEFIMSYLYREIESPADQEAVISLGTDDGAKLWVNGTKVYETRAHEAAAPDMARVKVKLKKGTNRLLLKIVNGSNPHGFYLTLLSDQELKAGK